MRERLEEHIKNELERYRGVAFPVKSGALERWFVKSAPILKLHPNPEDEFSKPEVGPSYRIISDYERKFRDSAGVYRGEPLVVEKMHPDGYMLANGHHRWAAYYRCGIKNAPITIVNLTHDEDIIEMINGAVHDKRVSLDLDEVVFNIEEDGRAEKKPIFPFNRHYTESIRAGVPALFHYLSKYGYDIWVYTSKLYSMDHIIHLFKLYHVKINGVITGANRLSSSKMSKSEFDAMIAKTYKESLHIDNDAVVKINYSVKDDFEEFIINKDKCNWSEGVIKIIGELNAQEKQ